jgi:hypothetical protein
VKEEQTYVVWVGVAVDAADMESAANQAQEIMAGPDWWENAATKMKVENEFGTVSATLVKQHGEWWCPPGVK